jgi:hypothetical protein
MSPRERDPRRTLSSEYARAARYQPQAAVTATCGTRTSRSGHGELHDETAALELLSRAVRSRDGAAWEAFVGQYKGLVLSWVRGHPAYATVSEADSFWLDRTFQRFANAVGPDRLDLFPSLAAALQYLKMCAHSVLVDEARSRGRGRHVSLELLDDYVAAPVDVEGSVVGNLAARELWAAVLRELPDESERLIARLSFRYGYKPAQIQARHGHLFPSVDDVYRTKRNLLERLRRSPRLQPFLV